MTKDLFPISLFCPSWINLCLSLKNILQIIACFHTSCLGRDSHRKGNAVSLLYFFLHCFESYLFFFRLESAVRKCCHRFVSFGVAGLLVFYPLKGKACIWG